MIEYPFARATAINGDKLDGEIKAVLATLSYRTEPGRVIVIAEAALAQPVIDALAAVVTNHDPSQADETALASAQSIALNQAKVYLRNQLRAASPNTATIVTTVKSYINGNAILNTMLSNQIALMNGAFGWSIDLNPATAVNRQRFLLAVEMVISLIG